MLPDHVLPLQVLPDQVLLDHVLPDHVLPFQSPSTQDDCEASAAAICLESNSFPKMSTSPMSGRPPSVRCSVPRDSSSEPVPVDQAIVFHCFGALQVRAVSIADMSTKP